MTEQEINIAIAEHCGWRCVDVFEWGSEGRLPKQFHRGGALLPNFCGDLNAMHASVMSKPIDWRMAFQNALSKIAVSKGVILVELESRDWAACFLTVECEWRKMNA